MFNKSCLILDDDDNIREPFVKFLIRKGFKKVFGAAKASEALALIEKEKPDFILMDIQLEDEIDGVEILKRIKDGLSPASQVIMLSGHKGLFEKTCRELGAIDFWGKPMDPHEMLEKIQVIIPNKDGS